MQSSSSQNILAFDFGTKSIGVAQTNLETYAIAQTCNELSPLKAKDGIPNWEQLEALLSEWQPANIIVGLPLKMDGSDMEITRRARKFGNRIKGRFGYEVTFFDETLTTKSAKNEAYSRGHSGSFAKAPVDSIAARLILESWLNEQT